MLMSLLMGSGPCPCCAYSRAASLLPFWPFQSVRRPLVRGASESRSRAEPMLSEELHIDGATIVDPRDGGKTAGMTVITQGGRIVDVVPVGSMRPRPSVQVVDATGKFIVPGYNDMHSHVLELEDPSGGLALMLVEGVTGFRQMSGSPGLLELRRNGDLPIGKESPALLETPGSILTPFNAGSVEEVVAEIRRQKDQGADFVKLGLTSPEVFFAAIAEGKRVGIPILGHLQEGTDALEASRAGFRSIEHLGPGSTIWVSCSSQEEMLRADSYKRPFIKAPPIKIPFLERLIMRRFRTLLINPVAFAHPGDAARLGLAIDTFSEARCDSVAEHFVTDGIWHVPTLVRLRTQELADEPNYERDELLQYMPRENVKKWRQVTERFKKLPRDMLGTFRKAYPRQRALAKRFADSGVRMMVGTDGGALMGPGLTLRQEFAELAEAGFSPLKILQMATINPAEYLGRRDTMGTIERGRDADMVLLDADPLERVENLHRIAGVVRAGFYYSSRDLNALRSRVASTRGYLH
ncbi:amidohydrolase family protein [Melittangium boletus]|uniref:Amidohydrolase n=1 Tax=Melittangium boletus DSM 14713 TaxID=1294270 RepID=A0A250IKG1_9BACT|nr:amidohydrolase family protein [Melittangium boletus]ATB32254.1 amidohydrolase [Melittangium boletus DSM 14713]